MRRSAFESCPVGTGIRVLELLLNSESRFQQNRRENTRDTRPDTHNPGVSRSSPCTARPETPDFLLSGQSSALNLVDHCLGCFPYEVPLGGCPNKTQLEKNREPCYPGSPASWTSKVPASPFLCFVFCILGELESIPEEGCFCFQEKQRPGRECKGVGIPPTLAATCMMASAGSDTCSS